MTLDERTLLAVFRGLDAQVALDVSHVGLDKETARAVLRILRDQMRAVAPKIAVQMEWTRTEAAPHREAAMGARGA